MVGPDISIVIPCYNDGLYLKEAVDSVSAYKGKLKIEILIVNDGSDDNYTLSLFDTLEKTMSVSIIHQENKKMSAARNAGIMSSTAPYIIPLDADDLLNPDFIDMAYKEIRISDKIGVVYGDSEYFGEKKGVVVRSFNPVSQLYINGIVISSLVRKEAWEASGGFDENMINGYEDWEFWIRVMKLKWEFRKVETIALKYRIKKHSVNADAIERHTENLSYIQRKHIDLFSKNYIDLHREIHDLKNNRRLLFRYLMNNIFGKRN